MLCWVIMIFLVPLYEAPRLDRLDLEETADVCPNTCTNQNRLKCTRSREHPGSTVRVRDEVNVLEDSDRGADDSAPWGGGLRIQPLKSGCVGFSR